MIARERLLAFAHAGVQAPSGDNSQPWTFDIRDDSIIVHSHPEIDHPILNLKGRGTWLSTGAVVENIVIAAEHSGFGADVTIDTQGDLATVTLSFTPAGARSHPLYESIRERHTHRGAYASDTLPAELAASLRGISEAHCAVHIVSDRENMRRIGRASSMLEEAALSTRKLHTLFFDSILWSEAENETGMPGLYVGTAELPTPVRWLFRVIRSWPVMRTLNALGMHRAAARSNSSLYAAASACVVITVDREDTEDYINAGRCMQRAWLEVTRAHLSAQPLAGLIYLAAYLEQYDDPDLSGSLKRRIAAASHSLRGTVPNAIGSIAMVLRVGTPRRAATARSKRRPPQLVDAR